MPHKSIFFSSLEMPIMYLIIVCLMYVEHIRRFEAHYASEIRILLTIDNCQRCI
jgi:hypothetical protein